MIQLFKFAALLLVAEGLHFQPATVAQLASGRVHMTRVRIQGRVTLVKHEADGDLHIRISDGSYFIVAECMPQLPCTEPRKGQTVEVEGVTRFDGEHKWWEIHPVTGLRVVGK